MEKRRFLRNSSIGEASTSSSTIIESVAGKKGRKRRREEDAGRSETEGGRVRLHPELQKEALRIAKQVGDEVIRKDEETGRKKLLEDLNPSLYGLIKRRSLRAEKIELPGYYDPWTKPVATKQSAFGMAVTEEDYIPQTFLLGGKIVEAEAERKAETEREAKAETEREAKELPVVEKFPNYSAWSPCPRNEVTESERVFQGLPGDLDDKFVMEWAKEFGIQESVEKRRIKNLLLSDRHIAMLVQGVRACDTEKSEIRKETEEEVPEKVFEAISEAFGGTENGTENGTGIMNRYYRSEADPRQAFLPNLSVLHGKPPTVARFLDSCSRLICNRCFRYDCLEHPFTTSDKAPQVFPMEAPTFAEKACKNFCHLKSTQKISALKPFTQAEQVILKCFLTENAEEDAQTYCDMAVFAGRSCWETFFVIQELIKIPENVDDISGETSVRPKPNRGPRRNSRRHNHIAPAGKKMRQDLKNAGQVKQYQYQPCSHGRGTHCSTADAEICNCVDRNTYCERFCGCDETCPNRFGGCNCTGDCRTKRCPCFVAKRECDPEVCKCQAKNAKAKFCKNTPILFNSKKKVKIGPSKIHGFGAFILEDILEGDFICEYTGEVISQEEAERRGKLYDQIKISYLFDLNLEFVVDAAKKGNKIRYANHSKKNPNCIPEIFRVQGDNRIGLFAKRNLKAGEELFFDYSYTGDALKFVQNETNDKKNTHKTNSLDPRVFSMEQNNRRGGKINGRTKSQKVKNYPIISFEEVEGQIQGMLATLAFAKEEEEQKHTQELEIITKDFDMIEPVFLKPFSGDIPYQLPATGSTGSSPSRIKSLKKQLMDEAYKDNFPENKNKCPEGSSLSPIWEKLAKLSFNAEKEVKSLSDPLQNGRRVRTTTVKSPRQNGHR